MHPSLLQNISQPRDLKRLSSAQIQQLCGEIRQFLLDSVSKTCTTNITFLDMGKIR